MRYAKATPTFTIASEREHRALHVLNRGVNHHPLLHAAGRVANLERIHRFQSGENSAGQKVP